MSFGCNHRDCYTGALSLSQVTAAHMVTRSSNTVAVIWFLLTHWGRVAHICVGKITNIGSDNGLSRGRRQAMIWTIAGILLIGPLGTNFSEILIRIQILSFKKMRLKMSSAKWQPFCLGLNVLKIGHQGSSSSNGHQMTCPISSKLVEWLKTWL